MGKVKKIIDDGVMDIEKKRKCADMSKFNRKRKISSKFEENF